MTTLTIGGLSPTADPVKEHGQDLGRAIVGLSSGDKELRRKSYLQYYALRRFFTEAQWRDFVSGLDHFRKLHNHKSLLIILEEVKSEVALLPQRKEPEMAKEKTAGISPVKKFTQAIIAVFKQCVEAAEAFDEALPYLTGAVRADVPSVQAKGTATESTQTQPEEKAPESKEPEQKSAKKETKAETQAEEAIDPVELRKSCVDLIKAVSKKHGKDTVKVLTELFSGFGVKGVTDAPDPMLPEIKAALEKAANG